MKIFKLSLSALLLASLFISCDKGNDNPPAPNGGEGSFKGVVFAAGITNPEGNGGNVYMQARTSARHLRQHKLYSRWIWLNTYRN